MKRATINFEAAALAYIRYVLEELGIKPTALAHRAGLSSTTITRALNDPGHKYTLSTKTLEKIAATTGISPGPFLHATSSVEMATLPYNSEELRKEEQWGKLEHYWPQDVIYIGGEIAHEKWRELGTFDMMVGRYRPLLLTSSVAAAKDVFACIVLDNSANQIAAKGENLICIRPRAIDLRDRFPVPAIVERRSAKDFKVELTVRLLRESGNKRTLSALNRGKPLFAPITYTATDDPPEDLRIVGIVEYVVREPLK